MFYLGFNNYASAELCLLVFGSFMFYFFHSKRDEKWMFLKNRPSNDLASIKGEVAYYDLPYIAETMYADYGDLFRDSTVYAELFYEEEYTEEEVVERMTRAIERDPVRKELRRFINNEVTERWFMLYKKYYDPKYMWYS